MAAGSASPIDRMVQGLSSHFGCRSSQLPASLPGGWHCNITRAAPSPESHGRGHSCRLSLSPRTGFAVPGSLAIAGSLAVLGSRLFARTSGLRQRRLAIDSAAIGLHVIIAAGRDGVDRCPAERLHVATELTPELWMAQRKLDCRLEVPQLAAAVIALARKPVRIDGLFPHQGRNAIGKLDLTACSVPDLLEVLENRGHQDVAAHDGQIRWRLRRLRLLHDTAHTAR